jgi:sugar lactone lactonase YvrE
MVFDTRGRLLVSDSDDGAIYVVAQGRGVRTLVKGGLIMPGGVAVMSDASGSESLYVADLWSLSEFDPRSGRLVDIDSQNRFGPGIVESWTVAADDGAVILTSWMSNAVQVWDPTADQPVETLADFVVPLNALRFRGELVAAELGTGSVVSRDADGNRTTLLGGLAVPSGLAATETDLWAADWATGRVWHVSGEGSPSLVASGLMQPEGMAVDHDGSLLVVESGLGRLSRIDPTTGLVSTVVEGLGMDAQSPGGIPPTFVMSSVTVDSGGTLLVSGAGAEQNIIYRVRATPAP